MTDKKDEKSKGKPIPFDPEVSEKRRQTIEREKREMREYWEEETRKIIEEDEKGISGGAL